MKVPFLDLKTQHQELEEALVEVFRDCLRNASFIGGPRVQHFEEEFARFCETKYCVGVNSGTDALRFALIAAGIGPGDEVITVPNTFIATTEAISQVGAAPAFVDIDERTYNMDPNKLEDYMKKRIQETGTRDQDRNLNPVSWNLNPARSGLKPGRPKAVIPVHLYGQPADLDPILDIADRYGLKVIEDSCQAHGALYYSERENQWRKAGSMGLAAAFSFYPGKNLGACGEGGAVTTNDDEIANKIRMLRDHGQNKKYYHEMEGYNGRLDTIQAGILTIKLKHLQEWNEKRRSNAQYYNRLLDGCNGILPPFEAKNVRAVYHLYVIRTKNRDRLLEHLSENGIGAGLHYPFPLHLQQAYKGLRLGNGKYPLSEKVAKEILSLPMDPTLSREGIETVVNTIKTWNPN